MKQHFGNHFRRDKRKKKRKYVSHSAQYQKYEICMQQEIRNRKFIHFETLVATHESLPTAIAQHHLHTIQLEDCKTPIQREIIEKQRE